MDWLRREINKIKNETKHIKECMMEVAEYLKEEVYQRLSPNCSN
jgi:hypothetical protein